MNLTVGQPAPGFKLMSHLGKEISLEKLRGKICRPGILSRRPIPRYDPIKSRPTRPPKPDLRD